MGTCGATRTDGQPCTAGARASGFCFAHDPALREKRDAARQAGGHNKAAPRRLEKLTPTSLRPVLATLFETLEGIRDGTLEPRQATAMATVSTAICRIFEVSELEQRLKALEGRGDGQQRVG